MNTKIVNKFRCYIIGEDSLANQCIKIILEQGHFLLGICSPSEQIRDFAQQNDIPYTDSVEILESWLKMNECDFLFSVVNSRILSKSLLKLPRYFTINYHNSPLPKYAGVHATSWAILNNETYHGVTWHVVDEGIDTGDILKQTTFEIDEQETNFSLDVKCIEKAIPLFKELLEELADSKYKRVKQDFKQRSYYTLYQKPKHYGVILWSATANKIYTTYRALNFSGYTNKLCLPKFIFNGVVFFARKVAILNKGKRPSLLPGTVVEISNHHLRMTTATNDIALSQLIDTKGKSYTISDLADFCGIKKGDTLPLLDENFLSQLELRSELLAKSEAFWINTIEQIKNLNFWTLDANQSVAHKKVNLAKTFIYNDSSCKNKILHLLPKNVESKNVLMTMLLLYLYRLNNYDDFSIGYECQYLKEIESGMDAFFADIVPMNLSFTPDIDLQQAVFKIEELLKLINKHKTFAKDVIIRYPQLTGQILFPIIISAGAPTQKTCDEIGNCLYFVIDDESVILYHADNLDVVCQKIIDNMVGHLQIVIDGLLSNQALPIKNLPILTVEEKQLILGSWNNTKTSYPKNQSIAEIFEQQVAMYPGNVAVKFNDTSLTYEELNRKVKILNKHLANLGVTNNSLVGIYFDRGINAVVSILSIISLGAAYVSIDTAYSEQYIKDILNDTKVVVLLAQKNRKNSLEKILQNIKFTSTNSFDNELLIYKNNVRIETNKTIPGNLAYIMYTSGSTGKPKGVMIDHKAIIRLVKNTNYINIVSNYRVAQAASLSFDAATFEIWGALLNGAMLVCANIDTVLNVEKFDHFLQEEKIDVIFLTTALFNQHATTNPSVFRNLKYLLVGGEVLNPNIIHLVANYPNGKPKHFCSVYGPTENTTFTTMFPIQKDFDVNKAIPIGKPIANTTTYVLDKNLNLMPIGIPGELVTGGDGLSVGYLNNKDITKEKFIELPVLDGGKRLYKTGDVVKWLPDGNLDFVKRIDNQVKIRGFRIELDAIELCLLECDAVSQCAVITKKEGENHKSIVAYIVLRDKSRHVLEIKEFLAGKLPNYMIPSIFVIMEKLPLTQNGKVNKKLLPIGIKDHVIHSKEYTTPKTELENKISDIWKKLLGLDEVSINDDFFSLGGNSLLITEMVALIGKSIKIEFSFHEFLEEPTIQNLVKLIEKNNDNASKNPSQFSIDNVLLDENIKPISQHNPSLLRVPSAILLTGATGFLGSHLLNNFCDSSISSIYCLVRADSDVEAAERLNFILVKYGLNKALNNKKVNIIRGDITKPLLGLDQKMFDKLSLDIDCIYHCAAHVHHIYNYKKLYSANVASTLEILKLATNKKDKHVHYISTLATARNYLDNNSYIIEDFLDIENVKLTDSDNGYTQTKLLSELLLSQANNRGIKVSIYRPGWVTGHSKTGVFAHENNHLFLLLKGCIQMGYAPKLAANFKFVPVDFISKFIVRVSLNTKKIVPKVFNLVNYFTLEWGKLIDYMIAYGYRIKKISPAEWCLQLSKIEKNNALYPLLSLYMADGGINWAKVQNQFSRTSINNTNTAMKAFKMLHVKTDYKLFKRYFEFLEKEVFMPKTSNIFHKEFIDIAVVEANLEKIASLMPGNFYWKDRYGYYLGCNQGVLNLIGLKSEKDIVGKTDYDLWPEQAETIRINDNDVMDSGIQMEFEETVLVNGTKQLFFTVIKTPLKDKNENIVGVIGTSLDITYRKKLEKEKLIVGYKSLNKKIDNYLKEIASCMPGNFYWKDRYGRYLGCNKATLKMLGFASEQELVGKTDYDLWPEQASEIQDNDKRVLQEVEPMHLEEIVTKKGHNPMFFEVIKIPLKDADGNIVGIIGNSLDITYRKDTERLKLEYELQKTKLKEQEQFKKIVDQMVHDIRSPIASLLMILKSCEEDLPERARIALREAAIGIGDIANNMLNKYKKDDLEGCKIEEAQVVMLALTLTQLLSEKKHQYKESPIKFACNFCQDCEFICIKIELSQFKRMMSNLINNSVDALDNKDGKIDLFIDIVNDEVKITVRDNGKGMPQEVIDKILNNIAITANKKYGHGIGFVQIRETLQRYNGKLGITSKVGQGTEISLTFPIVATPEWLARKIELNKGDTVIVLDDDNSIHNAWETKFKEHQNNICLKHFTLGEEAISFINNFPEKEKIFLLADFELLKQELNGLHVIERTSIERSILVTSHYTNLVIRDLAIKSGTKILPKMLASEVSIKIIKAKNEDKCSANCNSADNKSISASSDKKVKLVFIDDDFTLIDALCSFIETKKGRTIDKYYNPKKFLDKLPQYTKDTKIFMDNDFKSSIDGINLAKQLHENGYTNLYLLSGKDFDANEVPSYLTVISKIDTDKLLSFID